MVQPTFCFAARSLINQSLVIFPAALSPTIPLIQAFKMALGFQGYDGVRRHWYGGCLGLRVLQGNVEPVFSTT